MTTVIGNVADLIGRPALGASLRFYLVTDGSDIPTVSNGKIHGTPDAVVHVDSAGAFECDLPANDSVLPAGTYYSTYILTPKTWDNQARVRSNVVARRIDHVVPIASGPVNLANQGLWVLSPAPPEWAPLQGPPGQDGEDGEDGEDAIFGTLPQTTLCYEGGAYNCDVPGQAVIGVTTEAIVADRIYYEPIEIWDSQWFDLAQVIVTTGPSVDTGIGIAVYTAGRGWLPETLVATCAQINTGTTTSARTKEISAPGPAAWVPGAGRYQIAIWAAGAVTMRRLTCAGSRYGILSSQSQSIHINRLWASRTYDGIWPEEAIQPSEGVGQEASPSPGEYHWVSIRPSDQMIYEPPLLPEYPEPADDVLNTWLADIPAGEPGNWNTARLPSDVLIAHSKSIYKQHSRYLVFDCASDRGTRFEAIDDYSAATQPAYPGQPFSPTYGYKRGRRQFYMVDSVGLVVQHLDVLGANPTGGKNSLYQTSYEGQHGIDFNGGADVTLEDYRSEGAYGDGFSIGGGLVGFTARFFYVTRNGRQGFSCGSSASNIVIGANKEADLQGLTWGTFVDIKRSAVDFEPVPTSRLIAGAVVRGLRFEEIGGSPMSAGGSGTVNDLWWMDCTTAGNITGRADGKNSPKRRQGFHMLNIVAESSSGLESGSYRVQRYSGVEAHGNVQRFHSTLGSVSGFLRLVDCCPEFGGDPLEETISDNAVTYSVNGSPVPQFWRNDTAGFDCAAITPPGEAVPEHGGPVMIAYRRY